MDYRKALISSTIAIACYAAAAHADAKADSLNPYLPVPAASTETADHGAGTYCRIGLTIPAWTCDQELAMNGENKEVPVVEGRHHVAPAKPTTTPPSPPSPPGPTTGGDL